MVPHLNGESVATKTESAQQLEALDKHRRRGQQTVVVEHVHVNDGGQAIVGSVSAGRGQAKSEEQPHASCPPDIVESGGGNTFYKRSLDIKQAPCAAGEYAQGRGLMAYSCHWPVPVDVPPFE